MPHSERLQTIEQLRGSKSPVMASFTPSSWDDATNSVEVAFYTGAAVERYSFDEGDFTMAFDLAGARLERYNAGAPVLKDHADMSSAYQVGKVLEGSAVVADGVCKCRVQFSRDPAHAGFVGDVRDGIRKSVSMGAKIGAFSYLSKRGVAGATNTQVLVTDWEPYELSFVPVQADPGAQTLSATQEPPMSNQTFTAADLEAAKLAGIQAERERQRLDAERRSQILQMSRHVENAGGSRAFVEALAADETVTVAMARERVMAEAERLADAATIGAAGRGGRAEVGANLDGQLGKVYAKALAIKMGATQIKLSDAEQSQVPQHLSMRRMCEEALRRNGVRVENLTDEQVVRRALERCDSRAALQRFEDTYNRRERLGEITTSDLPLLFTSTQALVVMDRYNAAPMTYQAWTKRVPLSDFRPIKMIDYSRLPALQEIPESGIPVMGGVAETGEEVGLKEWGISLPFSRRAIINDRYDMIGGVAAAVGMRVGVQKNARAYAKLVSNPTLTGDSVAVYNSAHGNVGTTGALSATTLGELRKKVREQRGVADPSSSTSGMRLNLQISTLVVGSALETTAEQLFSNLYTPTAASGVLPASFRSQLRTLVADAEISSATAFYVFADPMLAPCFVESVLGDEGILTDMVYDEESRGVKLIVRTAYDFTAVSALGTAYNAGA